MKLAEYEVRVEAVPLTRPYTIATRSVDAVKMISLRIRTEAGTEGLGSASPAPGVTGETLEAAAEALAEERVEALLAPLPESDLRTLVARLTPAFRATPAAGAALDMALLDAWSRELNRPLVEALGRRHDALPTSITIGIKSVEATVAEAEEYVGRGFSFLKVKLGHSLEEDLERLRKLRERFGARIVIRVDANQGYSLEELRRFFKETHELEVEFVEQPLKTDETEALLELGEAERRRIALDESLQTPEDAEQWAVGRRPAGIYNIKLMKCGGVSPALEIAGTAERAGIGLMWGCMDESRVGIAAALHAALACPATRYLDLDGSLDLARDFAEGGFRMEGGIMRTLDKPGLGARFV